MQNLLTQFKPTDICYDSRRVREGCVFVALRGTQTDGHQFIGKALQQGALAIVCESWPADLPASQKMILVPNSREALAQLSAEFYQFPSRQMLAIGVTGTNGKTSSTYLLESVLNEAKLSPAVFGTINYRHGKNIIESTHTTPESLELQKMLRQFCNQGARSLAIEVSSHALIQHRADAIDFDAALFTNLSPEHLDYHADMNDYFEAKCLLFESLLRKSNKKSTYAVVNVDDAYGVKLAERLKQEKNNVQLLETALSKLGASVFFEKLHLSTQGLKAKINGLYGAFECESALVGAYNASNVLGVIATCLALAIDIESIQKGIAKFKNVPGRLEKIENNKQIEVFVDYAHTPDALANVISALRNCQKQDGKLKNGKLKVLFGCGGDRDAKKRPLMGEIVAKFADTCWVTSDNPRTENPMKIIEAILPGLQHQGWTEGKQFFVESDRRKAIQQLLESSEAGDVLLIAGKGHEDYQIIGKEKFHFDDREEVRSFFGALSSRT